MLEFVHEQPSTLVVEFLYQVKKSIIKGTQSMMTTSWNDDVL